MNRFVFSLALVGISAGLVALGCGTDTTGQTSSGSNGYTPVKTVPLENLSAEFAKAYCASLYTCCTTAELTDAFSTLTPPPKTEAECEVALKAGFDKEPFGYVTDRVMNGVIAYDADKAAKCFAALATTCQIPEDFVGKVPACNGVFVGLVADSGACNADVDCATAGSQCNGTSQGSTGTCGPLPKETEQCPDLECAAGLVCIQSAAGQICKVPVAEGQACDTDDICIGHYCDFTTMVCAPKKANGETCDNYNACKDGWCDILDTKICKARMADGAACMTSDECISLNCDGSNKCTPVPPDPPPACDGK